MNTSIESIDDLSKFSKEDLFSYIRKLQATNTQKSEAEEQLRHSNIKLNNELAQLKDENARLSKDLKKKSDCVANINSILNDYFNSLLSISEDYYGFVCGYKNIDLGKSAVTDLKKKFNLLVDISKEVHASRMLAVTASLNVSKSEKNKGKSAAVAVVDDQSQDVNSAGALLDISYDDDKKARYEEFVNALEHVELPITDFAPNCQLVKNKYNTLRETTLIGKAIKPVFDGSDNGSSLAKAITVEDILDFAFANIQPNCVSRTSVSANEMEPEPVIDLVEEKVKNIRDTDLCLEAGEKEFTRVCPHCGKKCTAKLDEPKYHKPVVGGIFNSKDKRCLVPFYIVKCTKCNHTQTLSLLEMNIEKLLHVACVPYLDKNCVLFDPKASIMDKIRSVAEENQCQDLLELLDKLDSQVANTFNYDESIAHINELKSHKNDTYNYQKTLCNQRAKDIKCQPHTTTIISNGTSDHCEKTADTTQSAFMPAFKHSKISIAMHANTLAAQQCYSSKSKHHMANTLFNQEELLSRSRLMEADIEFSRAYLSGVSSEIKKRLLSESTALHIDESPVNVVDLSKKETTCGTGWLWGMASSMTSEHSMVYMEACESRAASNFLPLIEYNDPETFKARKIQTDGYAVYPSSQKGLKGDPITFAGCFAHCRRPIHLSFYNTDSLKIYNEKLLPEGADVTDFLGNLQKLCNDSKYDLSVNQVLLLIIYYIINTLFSNDASVIDAWQDHSCQEFLDSLHKVRQEKSADLLAALNLLVELFISINNNIKLSANKKTYQRNGPESRLNKFFTYWMNLRNSLVEFINSPHIALSNNMIERSFRLPAISKHVSLSYKTLEGFKAFANHMTILENCAINNVSVKQYIPWLAANIQERINDLPQSEVDEAIKRAKELFPFNTDIRIEKFRRPTKFSAIKGLTKKGKNITEKLDIYDPRNPSTFLYDAISYEGLTPFDFSKSLNK